MVIKPMQDFSPTLLKVAIKYIQNDTCFLFVKVNVIYEMYTPQDFESLQLFIYKSVLWSSDPHFDGSDSPN